MTSFTAALPAMRAQIEAQITGNGVVCDVTRIVGTADNTGRKTGAWASLVSGGVAETMWIQPFTGRFGGASNIALQGLNAETTHVIFQKHNGTQLIPKDRIVPAGGGFVYDVIDSQTHETHRESMVKQVRRV